MHTIDWNWFFSSLSQSAAAIVGIFGAFILTKVLSNQASFTQKRNRISELITTSNRIIDDVSARHFTWYNKHADNLAIDKLVRLLDREASEWLDDSEQLILSEKSENLPDMLYQKVSFSPYTPRNMAKSQIEKLMSHRYMQVKNEEESRNRLDTYKKLTNKGLGSYQGIAQGQTGFAMLKSKRFIPPSNISITNELQKEKELIDEAIRSVRHQMRVVSSFLETIRGNPESSRQITYSLWLVFALFCVGVIYPLSFMPVAQGEDVSISFGAFIEIMFSLRGILLGIVSVIFSTVLAMFHIINSELRYTSDEIESLSSFTKISSYSKYLQVNEENRSLLKSKDY